MKSSFSGNLSFTIFGESHGSAIGVTIEGLPVGFQPDMEALRAFLSRRAPGNSPLSSSRKEADLPEFVSGLFDGRVCGGPVTALIRNTDARSSDYDTNGDGSQKSQNVPRPGHADYTAELKYRGFQDYRGGGSFSGRMTAPLCIVGGLCLQLLAQRGIAVSSRAVEIGGISGSAEALEQRILQAKAEGDSVGGIIEVCAAGVPGGLGGPLFEGLEGRIAQTVFAIPAVKGIEFGSGFEGSRLRGSENNDPFRMDGGEVITASNRSGGILGGISDGMPLVFRVAVKPTPSIGKTQQSVDIISNANTDLTITGRHDPCIVPRALPCMEAATAIVLLDALLERKKEEPWT